MQYHRDKEYMTYVGHLIQHPKVQKLADIPHHIHSNRLEHSIHVSYTSYKLAKNLVGMPKFWLRVASCMTSFTMIGARPSLRKVTPGSIPALPWKCTKDPQISMPRKKTSLLNTCGGYPCSASLQKNPS